MGEAKEAYENASQRYSKTSQQGHSTRMLARARFAEFWLADDSNSKRNIIAESARLAEESAKSFEAEADTEGQAMSHRDLLDLLPEVQIFAVDYETKKDAFMNSWRSREKNQRFSDSTCGETSAATKHLRISSSIWNATALRVHSMSSGNEE